MARYGDLAHQVASTGGGRLHPVAKVGVNFSEGGIRSLLKKNWGLDFGHFHENDHEKRPGEKISGPFSFVQEKNAMKPRQPLL